MLKKVCQHEKSTPTPLQALLTNISYGHTNKVSRTTKSDIDQRYDFFVHSYVRMDYQLNVDELGNQVKSVPLKVSAEIAFHNQMEENYFHRYNFASILDNCLFWDRSNIIG